jgi:superfamily II DNA or RNA helicase
MYLLLNFNKPRTLIQLCTGFGKSFMLGMMAQYLLIHSQSKVVVVVPNEVLAAIQQQKYAPWASKDIADLFNPASACISYCTYQDALIGAIPFGTTLLVDEIDSFVFSD